MSKKIIEPLKINNEALGSLSKDLLSTGIVWTRLVYKNEDDEKVIFEPVRQADGTYLLVGKKDA